MTPDQFEAWQLDHRAQEEARLFMLGALAREAVREFLDAEKFLQILSLTNFNPNFDREFLTACGIQPLE